MKASYLCLIAGVMLAGCRSTVTSTDEVNDSKTPLHLLKPDYVTPYGMLDADSVRHDLDRVFEYIDMVTPAKIVDADGNTVEDFSTLPDDAILNRGTYRLTSYEWAVTYMALLDASRTLDDQRYKEYVVDRICFLSEAAPLFREQAERTGKHDGQMRQVVSPGSLDDAGAMSAAFMRAALADSTINASDCIERYYNVVENNTLRLHDNTIARNRPHRNSVWLDDMFMSIPAMAARSRYTGDEKYLDEAVAVALGFIDRMWMPDRNLFRHGYLEGHTEQPSMAWGRANGWAILSLSQLIDALPEDHPQRGKLLDIYKKHIDGIVSRQNKDGFWHQLMDRNDSYPETSATAIFAYAIAHGINEGWLDPTIYGPSAHLAWEAVASKINDKGEVEGVCVGTGMAFDPAYYYHRPVSVKAAHGYGPVIWAASEIIRMINNYHPRVNDSAVHYYNVDPEAGNLPIFSVDENGKAIEILH
ncbi:MAG: glycoside hydrolase family 88 protein [Bacteroides sp.]|nr:glycoside hydrolase family 88 protein [Bacteroides sp.]